MVRMRRVLSSLAVIAIVAGLFASQAMGDGDECKNLQVLPKHMKLADVKALMKAQAKALGVECSHCHKETSMAEDTDKKKFAREQLKMVDEVNKKYFNGKPKVSCMTCHNGKKVPVEAKGEEKK